MEDRFDICVAFTLRREGGYVDDSADPGGATNMGITLGNYREWSDNPHLGDLQVKDVPPKTASAIYRSLYWNPLRGIVKLSRFGRDEVQRARLYATAVALRHCAAASDRKIRRVERETRCR